MNYCPTCGNEITVDLKYCNRCGANLTLPTYNSPTMIAPVKLTLPSIALGITIMGSLGIIFGGATEFARQGLHPAAIVWMVLFCSATLFGCVGLMIRFWTKLLTMQREISSAAPPASIGGERPSRQHLPPPRVEPVPSVTEHTTRTFSPVYREPADRGPR